MSSEEAANSYGLIVSQGRRVVVSCNDQSSRKVTVVSCLNSNK